MSCKEKPIEFERINVCVNACATLKDPVNDIRDLVLLVRCIFTGWKEFVCQKYFSDIQTIIEFESTLSKFEGIK